MYRKIVSRIVLWIIQPHVCVNFFHRNFTEPRQFPFLFPESRVHRVIHSFSHKFRFFSSPNENLMKPHLFPVLSFLRRWVGLARTAITWTCARFSLLRSAKCQQSSWQPHDRDIIGPVVRDENSIGR